MDFDNHVNNGTTSNAVSAGQITDNNGLTSIINPQDSYTPPSISIGGFVPTTSEDSFGDSSSTPQSRSVSLSPASISNSGEEIPALASVSNVFPSVSPDLYIPSSSAIPIVTSQVVSSSQWQYSSTIPTAPVVSGQQEQSSSPVLPSSTIPNALPPSSTTPNPWTPSTNSYAVSPSTIGLSTYSYQLSSSSLTTSDNMAWTNLWIPPVSSTTPTSTLTPSTTLVIHKSELPGRSALGEHLSYLVAHPSSSTSNVPVPVTYSSKNSTTKLTSIKKTSSTLYPTTSSSSIRPSLSSSLFTSPSAFSSSSSSIITFSSSSSSSYSSIDPMYSTYTQEYFFTGETTSFSTGIPIILTYGSGSATATATTTRSFTPIITAPIKLYEKWLNGGGLDDSSNNSKDGPKTKTNTGTIAGSVVGAVGGVLVCCIIVWFIMFKRRRSSGSKNKWNDGSIIKSDTYHSNDHDEEEYANNDSSFSHSMGYRMKYESTDQSDPFKHEFEFDKRNNGVLNSQTMKNPPPVPAPRKITPRGFEPVPKLATRPSDNFNHNNSNNVIDRDNYHLRFSYASSETGTSVDSSTMGSYSTISSIPNRYGTMDNDKQGFLREIL